ncbi:DNA polymerase III subunit epsilon [Algimonas ampicilliniresistens]|uniref:DNA polymerase III subunit epsilon n=1 Tax=Algimonas ampicilliniresistens TaxID=1298735 RepID=A0ABQ5V9H3_9PROT|nr:DNA polymerase III subunit epsilon [Algimonas ampicilliniresistens]GLQ24103.1 DNA polymerase III subunit epsilon [Algimonas ampicilliniresistens]
MAGLREIVFDTETTGFDSQGADRITELGCIELIDWLPTGEQFHAYIDPERDVPDKVVQITGLTTAFLRGKPKFGERADDFLEFIGDSPLVAHNAKFDMGFINAELRRVRKDEIPEHRFIDTLAMANKKYPGSPASLDALCKRFDISLSDRDKHGAIIDSELLARVYLELRGGRERSLGLEPNAEQVERVAPQSAHGRPSPLPSLLSAAEKSAHEAFMAESGGSELWDRVLRRMDGRR